MPILVPPNPLPRTFYNRNAAVVAKQLLGKVLISQVGGVVTGGVIVETEAYLSAEDPACHACRGMRPRNRTMFGPPGHLYVYSIHAKYCMNAVTEREGCGSAVLIRASEPLWGMETMASRRNVLQSKSWTSGPARLCQALQIDRHYDGHDLTMGTEVWIAEVSLPKQPTICSGPRIGISQAIDLPLRFFVDRNPFVSGKIGEHSGRPNHEGLIFPER